MNRDLKAQENHFADWVLERMTCTMYLADSLRDTAFDPDQNAVLLRYYPEVPDDTPALKEMLVQRIKDIVEDDEDFPKYRIRVDAQQIMVDRRPNLLMRIRNAGETQSVDPDCIGGS